jgi:hypothetical protein
MPLITPEIEPRLYGAIRKKCNELKCPVLALGGIENQKQHHACGEGWKTLEQIADDAEVPEE